MDQRRSTGRTVSIALILFALAAGAARADVDYERSVQHDRYFGRADYGVRTESMAHVIREDLFILRQCGAEVAHRDTVRLFGRSLTAFEGDVAVMGSKLIGAPATGRALATVSIANGRFNYTPIDRNLREGVEVSPGRSYPRDVLSWGHTFWVGIIPVLLEVSAGGSFEVYARHTRVTSRGVSPEVRSTIGAAATITARGFAGLGLDAGVVSGRAGVELVLNLAEVALESPCRVGWNGVDMPVNLRFASRLLIRLTAQGCVFNPFDWSDFESCSDPVGITLVDYTFAERSWQLARFQVR
ncbi:MAG: hypothetical protein AAB434_13300 [Planctomycetota bacterium]